MKVALSAPVFSGGNLIHEVEVRLPGPRALKRRPRHVDLEIWNLAQIAGVSIEAAGDMELEDMGAIVRAFDAMCADTKAAAHAITAAGRMRK